MKAAISVPDATLERAEQKAHDLGWTRSEFYSTAAERFIDQIEREDLAVDSDAAVDNVLLPKETAGLPADSVVTVTTGSCDGAAGGAAPSPSVEDCAAACGRRLQAASTAAATGVGRIERDAIVMPTAMAGRRTRRPCPAAPPPAKIRR